jgi:iron-sulfur cluster assembly protein
MLQVTEKASEQISSFLKDKEEQSSHVRIFLSQGGCCSGPSLGMALDEPNVNDEVITTNNITYLIDKALYNEVKPITIDFIDSAMGSGFSITSNLSKESSGSCGSSCGSSCGCS